MNAKQKVIIDCDPGIDDVIALMLALRSPELEILGITVVCGNVPVSIGAQNVQKILEHFDREDIPIYAGATVPLIKQYVSAQDTHGEDGLGESFLPIFSEKPPQPDAAGFLCKALRSAKDITILALGPLTNIAALIRSDKNAAGNIFQFISMGGSYKSHGNCSPVAEYNYWCDPHAAEEVFAFFSQKAEETNRKFPLLSMVGLDVTRKIVLTPNILSLMERLNPETGSFLRLITKFYFDFHWKQEHVLGCVINDPLAAAFLIRPQLLSGFSAFTEIAVNGICEGQSVVDSMNFYNKAPNSMIYTSVHIKEFWILLFSRLLSIPEATAEQELASIWKQSEEHSFYGGIL